MQARAADHRSQHTTAQHHRGGNARTPVTPPAHDDMTPVVNDFSPNELLGPVVR
jgi:hypothetical protein